MSGERLEGDEWGPFALRVGQMSEGEEAAQAGIALAGLGEEHEVMRIGGVTGGPRGRPSRRGPRSRASHRLASARRSAIPPEPRLRRMGLMPCLAQAWRSAPRRRGRRGR